jgi:hypothetical protein
MASKLRKDAEDLRALGLSELAADVESVAINCQKEVELRRSDYIRNSQSLMPIVKRSRGDDVMRKYVLHMSAACLMDFNKCLSSTVATTASVALAKDIKARQVRDMVRANPGVIGSARS